MIPSLVVWSLAIIIADTILYIVSVLLHLHWHPFVMLHAHFFRFLQALQSSGNVHHTGAYSLVANSNQPHAVGEGSVGVAIRHWVHTWPDWYTARKMCCVSAALVGASASSGLPFFTKSSRCQVVLEYTRPTKRSRLRTEDSMMLRSGWHASWAHAILICIPCRRFSNSSKCRDLVVSSESMEEE